MAGSSSTHSSLVCHQYGVYVICGVEHKPGLMCGSGVTLSYMKLRQVSSRFLSSLSFTSKFPQILPQLLDFRVMNCFNSAELSFRISIFNHQAVAPSEVSSVRTDRRAGGEGGEVRSKGAKPENRAGESTRFDQKIPK